MKTDKPRQQKFVWNVVAISFGLCLSVVLLELGARLLAGMLGVSPYMRYDETVGWVARPNANKIHKHPVHGFEVEYRINSRGNRGFDYKFEKPRGVRRILVIGDSNGFGWGIDEEAHFAALLDASLDNTQVFNLSLGGYGTDQSLLRFKRDGVPLDPDIVILQLTPNDFEEIQYPFFNQKPKPQFILAENGDLQLTNVPVRSVGEIAEEFGQRSLPVPFRESLSWHSYAYNFFNQRYHAWQVSRDAVVANSGRKPVFSDDSHELFSAIVSELASTVDEIGAQGLIVHASTELSNQLSGREFAFPVIDVSGEFAEVRLRGKEPMFSDGYHWNELGHKLVADKVSAILASE